MRWFAFIFHILLGAFLCESQTVWRESGTTETDNNRITVKPNNRKTLQPRTHSATPPLSVPSSSHWSIVTLMPLPVLFKVIVNR